MPIFSLNINIVALVIASRILKPTDILQQKCFKIIKLEFNRSDVIMELLTLLMFVY
jgi:hypothetical protein